MECQDLARCGKYLPRKRKRLNVPAIVQWSPDMHSCPAKPVEAWDLNMNKFSGRYGEVKNRGPILSCFVALRTVTDPCLRSIGVEISFWSTVVAPTVFCNRHNILTTAEPVFAAYTCRLQVSLARFEYFCIIWLIQVVNSLIFTCTGRCDAAFAADTLEASLPSSVIKVETQVCFEILSLKEGHMKAFHNPSPTAQFKRCR